MGPRPPGDPTHGDPGAALSLGDPTHGDPGGAVSPGDPTHGDPGGAVSPGDPTHGDPGAALSPGAPVRGDPGAAVSLAARPPAPRPPNLPTAHLAGVDVLRAFACLWVVLFHLQLWWEGAYGRGFPALIAAASSPIDRALLAVGRLGLEGVSLFLVLSGFCLYYPLVRRGGVAGARVEIGAYARRRAGRIVPPYYASLALLTALSAVPATAAVVMRPVTGLDLATHVALVHNLVPSTLWTVNGAYWSLALEAQLYVVFPLLVVAARRWGVGAVAAFGLLASVLWFFALRAAKGAHLSHEAYGVVYEALPGRLGEFTAGMAAAAVVAEGRPAPRWALVPLAALFVPACHAVQATDWFDYPFERPLNGVSFGALVVLASRLPARFYRLAPARLLAGIGAVSYSLYLVHQPMLLALRHHVWGLRLEGWPLALLGLALATALGALFYAAFERPWARAGSKAAKVG